MADFLRDPLIVSVDAAKGNGRPGGLVLILTGDGVAVVTRSAAGPRLEEGFAARVEGSTAKVRVYTARNDLPAGQTISLEVTATDRCGHSTVKTLVQPI